MSPSNTSDHDKSASELEDEVNQERRKVASTIDALQEKISVGGIVDQIMGAVTEHGGDVGRNVGRTLKNNPLPLALTGIGLAWLMASSNSPPPSSRSRYDDDELYGDPRRYRRVDPYDDRYDDVTAYPPTGSTTSTGTVGSHPTSYATGTRPAGYTSAGGTTSTATSSSSGSGIKDAVQDRAASAKSAAASARDTVADRAASARDAVRDGAQSASDTVRDGAHSAGEAIRDGSHRIGESVSRAGEEVRYRAGRAGDRAAQMGRSARDGFDTMMYEQPLVIGALALAVGAAIGGALPRTRREDELMGEHRDRFLDQAEAAAMDQVEKGRAVADRVVEETRTMADEAAGTVDANTPDGRSMVDKAEAVVRESGERLKSAAVDEANKQNLGKVDISNAGSTSSTSTSTSPNRKV